MLHKDSTDIDLNGIRDLIAQLSNTVASDKAVILGVSVPLMFVRAMTGRVPCTCVRRRCSSFWKPAGPPPLPLPRPPFPLFHWNPELTIVIAWGKLSRNIS